MLPQRGRDTLSRGCQSLAIAMAPHIRGESDRAVLRFKKPATRGGGLEPEPCRNAYLAEAGMRKRDPPWEEGVEETAGPATG